VANGTFGRRDWGFEIGQVVGEWTITSDAYFARAGRDVVHDTRCSCGHEGATLASNLATGKSTRCRFCAQKKRVRTRKDYNGYAYICPDDTHRRRLMNRMSSCIRRCHNPKDRNYPNYGARGIEVHASWRIERHAFLAHLLTLPGWDDPSLELDRADCDKGYVPGNLRFVTRAINAKNKRKISDREATIKDLHHEIEQLQARLRYCQCGAAQALHGADQDGRCDRP
jgi:hypothetical protein